MRVRTIILLAAVVALVAGSSVSSDRAPETLAFVPSPDIAAPDAAIDGDVAIDDVADDERGEATEPGDDAATPIEPTTTEPTDDERRTTTTVPAADVPPTTYPGDLAPAGAVDAPPATTAGPGADRVDTSTSTVATPPTTPPTTPTPGPPTTAPIAPIAPIAPTTSSPTPTTTAAPNPAPAPGPYRLVWADEFDTFDPSHWTREHSTYGDGNQELQCYLPGNVTVADGVLRLTARHETAECPWETRDYSSGMVRSRGLVDWTRGRFEIRARMPAGQGFWPAAWLSPTDPAYGAWPRSGEIDIVEAVGSRTNRIIGSLHWYGPQGHRVANREFFAHDGFVTEWHTYAVTWEEGRFVWEIDGIEYHRVEGWDTAVGTGDAPFDQPFHLKLNLAVGGRAPGSPDATTPWPAHYEIDWVRVYQR